MKLVWSPLAVERALEAKAYIASDNPKAADKWASGLVSAVSKLKRRPKLGRLVPEIELEEYRSLFTAIIESSIGFPLAPYSS